MSSNSASNDKRLYSRLTIRSNHVQIFRGPGKKRSSTQGIKLRRARKGCFCLLSDSSLVHSATFSRFIRHYRTSNTSTTLAPLRVFSARRPRKQARGSRRVPRLLGQRRAVHQVLLRRNVKRKTNNIFFQQRI